LHEGDDVVGRRLSGRTETTGQFGQKVRRTTEDLPQIQRIPEVARIEWGGDETTQIGGQTWTRRPQGWWTKIKKVIAYKQTLLANEELKKAMNKQLVTLVQQTEKYRELLAKNQTEDDTDFKQDDEDDDDEDDKEDAEAAEDEHGMSDVVGEDSQDPEMTSSGEEGNNRTTTTKTTARRRKRRKRCRLTIEEALSADTIRKSKSRVIDYSRLRLKTDEFYGKSTALDASGLDASFSPEQSDTDAETTLKQEALQDELVERKKQKAIITRRLSSHQQHHVLSRPGRTAQASRRKRHGD
jgi:hypothetical protein